MADDFDNELDMELNVDTNIESSGADQFSSLQEGLLNTAGAALVLGQSLEYAQNQMAKNGKSGGGEKLPSELRKELEQIVNSKDKYFDDVAKSDRARYKNPTEFNKAYDNFEKPVNSYHSDFTNPNLYIPSSAKDKGQTLADLLGLDRTFLQDIKEEKPQAKQSMMSSFLDGMKEVGVKVGGFVTDTTNKLKAKITGKTKKSNEASFEEAEKKTVESLEDLTKKLKGFNEQYDSARKQLENIAKERSYRTSELNESIRQSRYDLDRRNEEKRTVLKSRHNAVIDEIESGRRSALKSLDNERLEEIAGLKNTYNSKVNELGNKRVSELESNAKEKAEALNTLNKTYEQKIKDLYKSVSDLGIDTSKDKNVIKDIEAKIEEAKKALEDKRNAFQEKMNEFDVEAARTYTAFTEDLKKELSGKKRGSSDYSKKKADNAAEAKEMSLTIKAERQALSEGLSKDITDTEQTIKTLTSLLKSFSTGLEKEEATQKKSLEKLESFYNNREQEIEANYKSSKRSVGAELNKGIDDVNSRYGSKSSVVRQQYDEWAKQENRSFADSRAQLQNEIKQSELEFQSGAERSRKALQDEFNKMEADTRKSATEARKNIQETSQAINDTTQKIKKGFFFGSSLRDSFAFGLKQRSDRLANQGGISGIFTRAAAQKFKNKTWGNAIDETGKAIAGTGFNPAVLGVDIAIQGLKKLGVAIKNLAKESSQAFADIQSIKTNLGVVYGKQAEANLTFSEIAQYSTKSPFAVAQMSEFAVLLKQSGVYGSELMDTLKELGDLAGGSTEKMKNLATVYARVVAMGKAQTRDLKMFATAGVPIYEALRKELGVDQKTLTSMVSKGEVSSEIIQKALAAMTSKGGSFYKAVEKNADTYKARRQNLSDIRQLGLAGTGEYIYDSNFIRGVLGLKEDIWTSIQGTSSKAVNNRAIKRSESSIASMAEFDNALKNLNSSTINNTEALKNVTTELKTTFGTFIEKWRTLGTQEYVNNVMPERNRWESAKSKLELLNSYKQAGVKGINFDTGLTSVGSVKLKDDKAYKFAEKALKEEMKAAAKKGESQLNEYNSLAYYQTLGMQNASKFSDNFGRFGKEKSSSLSLKSSLNEYYRGSDAYRKDKADEEARRIREIEERYALQKRLGMKSTGYSWMGNKTVEEISKSANGEDVKLVSAFKDFAEVAKILKENYSEGKLSLAAEDITKETRDILLDNIRNITKAYSLLGTSGETSDLLKHINPLESILSEDVNQFNEHQVNTRLSIAAGKFSEWVSNIQDESKKTILESLFINPDADLIDKKELDGVKIKYAAFWKRYSSSVLGISLEGLEKGISVSKQYDNSRYRTQNQAIAKAMMNRMSAEDVLSRNIVYSGVVTGPSGTRVQGVNQAETAKNFEKFATSQESTLEVAEAYLSQLESQSDTMKEFLSGASFKQEDLEKLYSPEWAAALGYNNKEMFVNAFSSATTKGADALKEFTDATMKAISASLKEVEAKKEYAKIITNLKKAQEDYKSDTNKTRTNIIADEMVYRFYGNYKNNTKGNGLSFEGFKGLIEKYANAFVDDKTGKLKIDEFTKSLEQIMSPNESIQSKMDKANDRLESARTTLEKAKADYQEERKKAYSENSYENIAKELLSQAQVNGYIGNRKGVKEAILNKDKSFKDAWVQTKINEIERVSAGRIDNQLKDSKSALNNASKEYDNAQVEAQQVQIFADNLKNSNEAQLVRTAAENEQAKREEAFLNYNKTLFDVRDNLDVHELRGGAAIGQRFMNAFGIMGNNNAYGSSVFGNNTMSQQTALNFLNGGDFAYKSFGDFTQQFKDDPDKLNKLIEAYKEMTTGGKDFHFMNRIGDSFDLENLNDEDIDKVTQKLILLKKAEKDAKDEMKNLTSQVFSEAMSSLAKGLTNTFTTIGESIRDGVNASEDLAKSWKNIASEMLGSIGASMTQCGLQIATSAAMDRNWGMVAAGLGIAALGGVASISSGMLSEADSSDDDNDQEYERLNSLKDALADLIEQAKTDAEYYQKHLSHRKALQENAYISSRMISVNDAVITPTGNVISTHPDDYLIATKTPDTLLKNEAGGVTGINFSPNITWNIVNQSSANLEGSEVKQTSDDLGNINFEVIIKDVVANAIADGEFDTAFAANQYYSNGRSRTY